MKVCSYKEKERELAAIEPVPSTLATTSSSGFNKLVSALLMKELSGHIPIHFTLLSLNCHAVHSKQPECNR